jgi:alpha-N-arabinofuranosidase
VLQAMLLTDGESMVLTPTYHVFEMNKGHQDAASLDVHLQGAAARDVAGTELRTLSASASVKGDTALVSISNLDAGAARDVEFDLRGRAVSGVRGRILTADALQDHNAPEHPESVAPRDFDGTETTDAGLRVTLPPHSFVTLELTLG